MIRSKLTRILLLIDFILRGTSSKESFIIMQTIMKRGKTS